MVKKDDRTLEKLKAAKAENKQLKKRLKELEKLVKSSKKEKASSPKAKTKAKTKNKVVEKAVNDEVKNKLRRKAVKTERESEKTTQVEKSPVGRSKKKIAERSTAQQKTAEIVNKPVLKVPAVSIVEKTSEVPQKKDETPKDQKINRIEIMTDPTEKLREQLERQTLMNLMTTGRRKGKKKK